MSKIEGVGEAHWRYREAGRSETETLGADAGLTLPIRGTILKQF